jgi:iron complex transport system substrate-binding protein
VIRLAGAIALALVTGCQDGTAEHAAVARRVVSLSPSTTEAMAAIGAQGLLVGRSRYCDYPPSVASLPVVGGFVDPNYEAILGLAPDLVIGARGPAGPALTERLAGRGIAVYFPNTESLEGIDAMLVGLGQRTGHAADATRTVADIDAAVSRVTASAGRAPRVRALLLFGVTPIVAAGPGSFPDELLRRAGAENVVTAGGAYPTLGLERLLVLDPDVIVDAAWGEDHARLTTETAGWGELRAVKAGRVVPLHDEVVLRPGPRVAEGLALLARAVHADGSGP